MTIKIGDNITFNVTFFYPDQPSVIATSPVEQVLVLQTDAGTHEEYVVADGSFVSELQLID